MTPLGHASVAYVAARCWRGFSVAGVLLGGLLPDVDFVLLPLPWFNDIHRVWTHNVFFVVLAAALAACVRRRDRSRLALSVFVGGALHLLADALVDLNPTNGLGVAAFWPLSSAKLLVFSMPTLPVASTGWSDPLDKLRILCYYLPLEFPFYVAAGWLLIAGWRRRAAQPKAART